MKNKPSNSSLFFTLFFIGTVSALTLILLATWADLEAAYYGFSRRASARLGGLSCPVLMTMSDRDVISLRLKNTTDGKLSPIVKVDLSSPVTAFEINENVELAAGEQAKLEWQVGPENLDLNRFIFANVLVYSSYPLPDREMTCGIFVLNLPGSGVVYTWLLIGLSLLGMAGGLYGLYQAQGPEQSGVNIARQLRFLFIVILLGLLTVFMGWWIQGILILVVAILFIVISMGILANRARA
ncbi:MAG: hypothetical protein IPP55_09030 [Anaerolineales bacterium]|nr:hypothetical protein [Anaerolineales bacterium]MBK9780182.1 hypothetical protein [Anaerolineales bacterium]